MRLDRTAAGLALTALAVLHMPSGGDVLRFGPAIALADQDGNGGEGHGGGEGNQGGQGDQGGNGSGGGAGNGGSSGEGEQGGNGNGNGGGQGGQGGEGQGGGAGGQHGSGSDDDDDDDGSVSSVPATGTPPEPAFTQPESRGDVVPDEILVMVDAREALPSGLLASGFRVVETRRLPALDLSVTRLRLPRGLTPEAARALLLQRYPGLLVDLHNLYHPAAGEPFSAPDSAMRRIDWFAVPADCPGPAGAGTIAIRPDKVARAGMGERCPRISPLLAV
jgi:hypothetical protein